MNYWSVRIDRNELLYHHRELSPEGMHFWLFPASAPSFTYSQRVYIALPLTRYKTLTGDINYFGNLTDARTLLPSISTTWRIFYSIDALLSSIAKFRGIGTSLIVPTSLLVHPVCTYASSTEKKKKKHKVRFEPTVGPFDALPERPDSLFRWPFFREKSPY